MEARCEIEVVKKEKFVLVLDYDELTQLRNALFRRRDTLREPYLKIGDDTRESNFITKFLDNTQVGVLRQETIEREA